MNKKFTMLLSTIILSVAIPSITSYASNHWSLSDKTYVNNEHEGFWSDTYIGTVSVYGKDVLVEGQYFYYPNFSRITYDVQGDISRDQVDSYGENDGIQRTSQITVYDKWNLGSETKVYYYFGKSKRNTNIQPNDLSDTE